MPAFEWPCASVFVKLQTARRERTSGSRRLALSAFPPCDVSARGELERISSGRSCLHACTQHGEERATRIGKFPRSDGESLFKFPSMTSMLPRCLENIFRVQFLTHLNVSPSRSPAEHAASRSAKNSSLTETECKPRQNLKRLCRCVEVSIRKSHFGEREAKFFEAAAKIRVESFFSACN
jgi:hypothetical protein